MDLGGKRQEYSAGSIDIDSVDPDPFKQFESWLNEAIDGKILEPNAMTLSTVDQQGRPTQRTLLLKYFDQTGFVFFTNFGSRKSEHLKHNSSVSILFFWPSLQRQVEINGNAGKISTSESIKYFARRPRGSQLGAWVSQQSSVVSTRSILMNKLAEFKQKFLAGEVPMPTFWGGYRIKPERFEFWQGGTNRLHDRIEYLNQTENDVWSRQRLAP